jgi:uncharacterized protein YgiM (DUF1202 family)
VTAPLPSRRTPRGAQPFSPAARRALALIALGVMAFILACGSFVTRPTRLARTPTAIGAAAVVDAPAVLTPTATAETAATLVTAMPAATPTETPVPTPTPLPTTAPAPGTSLVIGQPARVIAAGGINLREKPGMDALRLGKLAPGAVVQVLEGPVSGPQYRWWRVRDRRNLEGWVAEGDADGPWLTADVGEPRPVNRPVVRGDTVVVTTQEGKVLTVRFEAGVDSVVARRLRRGARLTVLDGPVDVDGYRWWQVQDADGRQGWAAEGDAETRWLTPLE